MAIKGLNSTSATSRKESSSFTSARTFDYKVTRPGQRDASTGMAALSPGFFVFFFENTRDTKGEDTQAPRLNTLTSLMSAKVSIKARRLMVTSGSRRHSKMVLR